MPPENKTKQSCMLSNNKQTKLHNNCKGWKSFVLLFISQQTYQYKDENMSLPSWALTDPCVLCQSNPRRRSVSFPHTVLTSLDDGIREPVQVSTEKKNISLISCPGELILASHSPPPCLRIFTMRNTKTHSRRTWVRTVSVEVGRHPIQLDR